MWCCSQPIPPTRLRRGWPVWLWFSFLRAGRIAFALLACRFDAEEELRRATIEYAAATLDCEEKARSVSKMKKNYDRLATAASVARSKLDEAKRDLRELIRTTPCATKRGAGKIQRTRAPNSRKELRERLMAAAKKKNPVM